MNILTSYDDLQKHCDEFRSMDKAMTVDEVDRVIEILISVKNPTYREISELRHKIRHDYSRMFPPEEEYKMHIKWGMENKMYDDFKNVIIENLSDNTIYNRIMDAIVKNKVHFTISDIQQIHDDFITYCLDGFDRCNTQLKDDDDYETPDPPKCTNAEIFLVNCLSVCNKTKESKILTKIADVSMPCLRLMPIKYVAFEGEDLLDQIYAYYTTRELSPSLGAKRNVVILCGNNKRNAYDYADVKDNHLCAFSMQHCAMAIEFPYLCYVYPETACLSADKDINLEAFVGTDVVQLSDTTKKTQGSPNNTFLTMTKHTCKIASSGPCTYIGFSIGMKVTAMMGCPAVKGRAVVLV
jgi:hypothetical protein